MFDYKDIAELSCETIKYKPIHSMAGERQLKIQRSPVSKVRGTGRGEGGRTVCGNTFLEPVLKFADLAAHLIGTVSSPGSAGIWCDYASYASHFIGCVVSPWYCIYWRVKPASIYCTLFHDGDSFWRNNLKVSNKMGVVGRFFYIVSCLPLLRMFVIYFW